MIDATNLEEKLEGLRGLDFEQAESLERQAGNNYPEMSFSKGFQARLAAKALGVPPADIKELPLKEYSRICTRVFNFLFANLDEETQSEKSEA